ncbi:bifunctional glycosyltransferase/CDP-glycerol:glycerophosphate glycerophosphotransferase [Streptomyces reniochalinae]|uniref:CDP-glycerol:glycerophosphate glycerophosphotransferase n=1 Tax=Streptomyces reniochalinae TaxID=2250578 RepID=A0A367F2M0_9ACTN|nr:bifunctional glycosyltransferase family 2 protein/CDP-glycerol:glycerophosphate glycerophosphotransferase [Streptomyces reniochalinae]RCG24624.1 CDP-glycerol:glycerophosphate glycerophosphotransferase [Streptomyces reniochalinae]
MVRFSVVVPVFKVQGYLRECLDSVLEQSFTDLELIAVDDRSPDHSGSILDEYEARDPRVRVLHLRENVGLGRARNAGVAHAEGEYLLFLDSDDSYLPGALEAVDAQLTACRDPDVLVFDHQRSYWWGRREPSSFGRQLAATGTQTFSAAENPDLLTLFHVAWNKAYRRAFYEEEGLSFAPGLYEDAPVSNEAMVCARTIGCLPRVCVDYRQRHRGAITRSPGRRHFDIFPQYASMFAFLDRRPHLEAHRRLLFERMVSHLVFCLRRGERVRPADRRAYFRHAARHYRTHQPPGFAPPRRAARDFWLLAHDAYPLFAARETVRRARGRTWRGARAASRGLARRYHRLYYALQRRLPLEDDLAVYAAYWYRGAACNPAAIEERARQLAPHLRNVWIVKPEAVATLPPAADHVVPGSPRYWRTLARAKYFVNNVNFPDHLVKRPGQIHVMTHHGTPLKTMGLDQQPYPAAAQMSFRKLLSRADRWDVSVTSNPHSAEVWDRVYPCAHEDLPAGYPRNDRYATATAEEIAGIRARLGIPRGRIALLYAPTARDYRKGFVPRLDLERLSAGLGEEYVLLVRTHYYYGRNSVLRELHARGLVRDVSRHPSTEDLCLAADALITDYSSLMFDYANLDRPLVVHAPDWESYRDSRGVYFDLLSGRPGETPGPVTRTEEELTAVFRSGTWRGPEARALRAAFRARFCPWDDGRAAERVVRSVLLGEDTAALPTVLPLSERPVAPSPEEAEAAVAPDPDLTTWGLGTTLWPASDGLDQPPTPAP